MPASKVSVVEHFSQMCEDYADGELKPLSTSYSAGAAMLSLALQQKDVVAEYVRQLTAPLGTHSIPQLLHIGMWLQRAAVFKPHNIPVLGCDGTPVCAEVSSRTFITLRSAFGMFAEGLLLKVQTTTTTGEPLGEDVYCYAYIAAVTRMCQFLSGCVSPIDHLKFQDSVLQCLFSKSWSPLFATNPGFFINGFAVCTSERFLKVWVGCRGGPEDLVTLMRALYTVVDTGTPVPELVYLRLFLEEFESRVTGTPAPLLRSVDTLQCALGEVNPGPRGILLKYITPHLRALSSFPPLTPLPSSFFPVLLHYITSLLLVYPPLKDAPPLLRELVDAVVCILEAHMDTVTNCEVCADGLKKFVEQVKHAEWITEARIGTLKRGVDVLNNRVRAQKRKYISPLVSDPAKKTRSQQPSITATSAAPRRYNAATLTCCIATDCDASEWTITNCGHVFCKKCIQRWVNGTTKTKHDTTTCPKCKSLLRYPYFNAFYPDLCVVSET